ncbi:MAG: hypothetical protein IJX27_04565 [Clostridia bacterium]|nr:hypothetical protein [Clostridia bacterium]
MKKIITFILAFCFFALSLASCDYDIYVAEEITSKATNTSATRGTSSVTVPSSGTSADTKHTVTTHTATIPTMVGTTSMPPIYTPGITTIPNITTMPDIVTTPTLDVWHNPTPPDGARAGYEDVDFAGYTFTFASPLDNADGWGDYEVYAEENGEGILDSAISERNTYLFEYYDAFIEVIDINSGVLENDFATGSNNVDIVLDRYNIQAKTAENYLNFHDIGLKLENPCWDQNFIKDMTVNGKLYAMLGSFSLTAFDATWVMFFNKEVQESNEQLRDVNFYNLVYNNEWTLDKFFELSKLARRDDGNGEMEIGTDIFGFISDTNSIRGLYFGAGQSYVTSTTYANGYTMFESAFTEAAENATSKIIDIYAHESTAIASRSICEAQTRRNGALFNADVLRQLSYYAGKQGENPEPASVGVLPFPKLSPEQADYKHYVDNRAIYMYIPKNCFDIERMRNFLELYAYHSFFTVYNSYFNLYKYTYTVDTESPEMIDIIIQSRSFDLAYQYNLAAADVKYTDGVISQKNIISEYGSDLSREIVTAANAYRESLPD